MGFPDARPPTRGNQKGDRIWVIIPPAVVLESGKSGRLLELRLGAKVLLKQLNLQTAHHILDLLSHLP
jgi:hypothetical protein